MSFKEFFDIVRSLIFLSIFCELLDLRMEEYHILLEVDDHNMFQQLSFLLLGPQLTVEQAPFTFLLLILLPSWHLFLLIAYVRIILLFHALQPLWPPIQFFSSLHIFS